MKSARFMLVTMLILSGAAVAQADSVVGVPVTGVGGVQSIPNCPTMEGQVCFNQATGTTTFFIPLSASRSGVFGTTAVPGGTAGTFSDTGSGTANALQMFLMFSPVQLPVTSATLTFTFVDLDLHGVNDPANFFETVRFYDANGNALTPLITTNGQSGLSPYIFSVSGNSNTQTITISNITSLIQNPFYVELRFGSSYNTTGTNTPESLRAILTTTSPQPTTPPTRVPEPGTLLMFGLGLAWNAWNQRKMKR